MAASMRLAFIRRVAAHSRTNRVRPRTLSLVAAADTFPPRARAIPPAPWRKRASGSSRMEIKSKTPDVQIPQDVSLPDFVFQNFDQYGDRTAIVDSAGGRSYSFSEVRKLARSFGSALATKGFKKGDVVALVCPNVPEYPILFFGVCSIGAVTTPVNPLYTAEELTVQLQEARARLIVTVSAFAGKARTSAAALGIDTVLVLGEAENFESFSAFIESGGEANFPADVQFTPREDVAILPFSSGTTGLPKGVMLTHYNLVAMACMLEHEDFTNVDSNSVVLGLLPFFHIYGMMVIMCLSLRKGVKVVCTSRFEPEAFLKTIQEQKITHAALVPPIILFLSKSPLIDKFDLSSLIDITSGAANLGSELSKVLKERLPSLKWLRQGYGMTELSPVTHASKFENIKLGSVGMLLPNLECKIIDVESGDILGPGIDGELCIKGPTVMKGYLNNPTATSETIDSEGWLHTGDIGHYDEDEHFYIVDRIKELIKYKGFQVSPAELEALLVSHDHIEDAAVVGVPDPETGELPKAFVVRKAGADISDDDVIRLVEKRAAPHKKLRGGVEFVDRIPKTSSGKILRRELKAREFARVAGGTPGAEENVLESNYQAQNIPENMSWPDFVFQKFEDYGVAVALVDGDSGQSYTYKQLRQMTKKLASALAKRGFKKGDVLAIYATNCPAFAIVVFGVMRCGGTITSINPQYTVEEVKVQLQTAGATWLMTVGSLLHRVKGATQEVGIAADHIVVRGDADSLGCLSLSTLLEDDGSSFPKVEFNPKEDVALLPFSSGTTGLSKGVMLTHYNLVAQGCIVCSPGFLDFHHDSVVLGFLPFFHVYGLVVVLSLALHRGSRVVTMSKFEPDKFLHLLQDHKVTHLPIVPPVALLLAKHPSVDHYDLRSLKEVTSGAAVLGVELSQAVADRLPTLSRMRQGYGMTELSPVCHMTPFGNNKHGSIGVLLPNLECKVVSVQTGEALGKGQDGELCVRGPTVMKGYVNNPDATTATITDDGWLHTGDIGHCDEEEHFFIVDRVKELIKYKGYQVPPAELEALLISHPSVTDAAVIGVKDTEAGELPKAFVVLKANSAVTEKELVEFVEDSVAPYKRLRGGVEFIDAIPKSSSGKILRRELKDRVGAIVEIKTHSTLQEPKRKSVRYKIEPGQTARSVEGPEPSQPVSSCCDIL